MNIEQIVSDFKEEVIEPEFLSGKDLDLTEEELRDWLSNVVYDINKAIRSTHLGRVSFDYSRLGAQPSRPQLLFDKYIHIVAAIFNEKYDTEISNIIGKPNHSGKQIHIFKKQ